MDDTKKLIEKYKRELMELGRSAPKPAQPAEPAPSAEKAAAKSPKVIGYVSEESGEFPAVFDRIIAEAVANGDLRESESEINVRESDNAVVIKAPEGYPDIDSPEDDVAFSAGREPRDTSTDAPTDAPADASENSNPESMGRPEDNMNQGTGETISNFPVSTYSTYEEFEAKNTGGGSLVFMVFTASEALPVAGAAVTVSTRIDGEQREMFAATTNQSGETEARTLPAPSKSLSQDFDNDIQPFSLYDATVGKDGYAKVVLRDIPVFDGVRSIQRVAMIPEGELSAPDENITEVRNAE